MFPYKPLLCACLLLLSVCSLASSSPIDVIVETTDCSGETRFTSFLAHKLHKITGGGCQDPTDSTKRLQQVLVKSDSVGGYDVYWVTHAEAKNIMLQIKEARDAKIKRIEGPTIRLDINQNTTSVPPSPTAASQPAVAVSPPAKKPNKELDGPQISMLDPVVSATRSTTQVLTGADQKQRAIVGKVDAPAGLLSVTVNGVAADFDQSGVFKASVQLQDNQTFVSVVAIDKQGKKHDVSFEIRRDIAKSASNQNENVEGFGNYHALIIANTSYAHMDDLSTPKNDARVLSEILTHRYGFKVTLLENIDRYKMMTSLNKMRSELTEHDNLLIYYAGHGAFDKANNRGHWLPTDAEPDSTANWVSTIAITDIVNAMSAKHVLLVADSCYSGALTRNTVINLDAGMSEEAREKWLRTMAQTRSRHLFTSGGVKPVLDDGGNGHSVFASALIDVLKANTDVIESSSVFTRVKQKVETRAKELQVEQTPMYAKLQESEHEFGEFLLVPNDE